MTRTPKSSTKNAAKTPKPKKPKPGTSVAFWEDDPGGLLPLNLTPVTGPAPNQAATPLPFRLDGNAPVPAVYAVGTPEFRYYANAAALRRTADFWGPLLAKGTKWQVGATLPVVLDDGTDLNAFYTRGDFKDGAGLHFFHAPVAGNTYFSGESPDVCCHEMGHAVLDAIRPQLFDAQTIEAAAFHESFGDMSAMLSDLQVATFRDEVISETGGLLNRASRLSRLAEQLGAAIRVHHPDAVDSDCLRNAANSFFYHDPQSLPTSAPASSLSSEPHSFSRVFTAAFLDTLAAMFMLNGSTSADLFNTSADLGKLLVAAILAAPIVPDYYSQVAAHMVAASQTAPFDGKYTSAIKNAFVRRGILSLQAAATLASVPMSSFPKIAAAAAVTARNSESAELPKARISAATYGLNQASLVVHTAGHAKQFGVTSAATDQLGAVGPRSPQNAAESYTEDLFQRGRIDVGEFAQSNAGQPHRMAFTSHVVVEESGELVLKRRAFECGFGFD